MHKLLATLQNWRAAGQAIALATVTQTWGSAPRPVGAKMAVNARGEHHGSVSGGCVEGAVIETAREVIHTRQPRLLHYGVPDEQAWDIGLACGGEIEIFVEPLTPAHLAILQKAQTAPRPLGALTYLTAPQAGEKHFFDEEKMSVPPAFCRPAQTALAQAQPQKASVKPPEGQTVTAFIDILLPPSTLVIVGGVHIAVTLASLAQTLGYRTILIDPRKAFANTARFPQIDQIYAQWPADAFARIPLTPSTAIAALTHDPKIDDPALQIALRSNAFYVGALGSRTTHAKRSQRLREAGLTPAQIARLHAPIGLDIRARTPAEIALAIMAEIVAQKNQRKIREI